MNKRLKQKKRRAIEFKAEDRGLEVRQKRRTSLAISGVYLLILIILFHQVLFGGKDFALPDAMAASYTSQGLNYHLNEEGIYPLWNPYIFSGMPAFAASSYFRFVYLPSIIYLPLQWLFGVRGIVFQVLHYLIAGLGTYLLLRRWKLDKISSLFGGVAYMMVPYIITMLVYGHGSQMMCAVYIPLIFYAVDRLFEKPTLWNAGLAALLIGFQFQRAHVQIIYFTWMLIGAYYIFTLIYNLRDKEFKKKILSITVYFIIVLVIGFGMAAVLFIPVANYTPYSIRGGAPEGGTGFDYATQWSFHPKEIATFFIPSFYGFGGPTYWGTMPFTDYPNYMGIIVLSLAILTLMLKRRKITTFFAIIWITSLFIAFGKHFFLYKLFYNFLPYFNKFRVPSMMLIITQFCTAVLAGFGMYDLAELFKGKTPFRDKKRIKNTLLVIAILLGLLTLYLLLFKSGFKETMFKHFRVNPRWSSQQIATINNLRFRMLYTDFWIMILFLGSGCTLVYLTFKRKVSAKFLSASLLMLAFIDLYIVDSKIIKPTEPLEEFMVIENDPTAIYLRGDADLFRIYPINELFTDTHWMAFRIQTIGGYHPAKLNIYQEFIELTGFRSIGLLQMLNVKYLISLRRFSHPNFTEIKTDYTLLQGKTTPVAIYRFNNFLPRAFFTKNVKVIKEKDYIFQELRRPDFNPREFAILEKETQLKVEPADSQRVSIKSWGIHEMAFEVYTDKPSQLIISEVYYPNGWIATIDGERTEIYKTDYILRSVTVPPGKHLVELKFIPKDVIFGLIISCISTLLVAIALITGKKR